MLRSRSPSDFFAAQSDLLRDEMQAMIESGSRLSEISARIASDAARAFGEQFEGGEGSRVPANAAASSAKADAEDKAAGRRAGPLEPDLSAGTAGRASVTRPAPLQRGPTFRGTVSARLGDGPVARRLA